jgi:cell division protein FtsL
MNARIGSVLLAALVICALLLVTSQHESRRLFIELERAQAQAKQLDIEWRQLQLEQSSLGKHVRIEANARRELKMLSVNAGRTQYLEVGGQ